MNSNYDVLIIGGGPAGASVATILAEHGHRALVIEREKFPRYHVGESLIPFTFGPLERLGMIPKMKKSHFMKKYSVSFVQPDGRRSQPFYFHTRYDKETIAQTWQVLRSEFDEMLLNNAREKGAHVREETTVVQLLKNDSGAVIGVEVKNKDGSMEQLYSRLVIDASGKEAFASSRQGWRVGDPFLNKVAIWTYYKGSKRGADLDEGATTIAFVPDKGWFWHIPQHNDMVSVGIVAEGKYLTRDGVRDPGKMFQREIGENQWIKDHLSTGECTGEYWLTSEYSRHSKYGASPGLLLVGDAFAFLDPVFSSGVMLALKSGVLAGDAVHEALLANDPSPERFADYGKQIREGVENMRKLVYAFYDPNFSFKDVVMKYPEAGAELTDCLSGDLNKDYTPLWNRIREFVKLPEDLPYGVPLAA
ncbi:flavin-dependent dehydrogenase [Prosthecobacter fusiformis]|uniref:Flavin-dependent dehydrogenase n=1 Tax=Prosthecobacter fusiformis TaxID=48464 RepID=A0A4R7S4G6_9BACT|nr:NAD(P)/FAD-dependent oxidoreductase [Prosthecobacter fusiformis]TDU73322.1 flavin-dependent dehydrogenase [Prosthecobacter fusiformis]